MLSMAWEYNYLMDYLIWTRMSELRGRLRTTGVSDDGV